jgi:CheY-like chemotaxis protein
MPLYYFHIRSLDEELRDPDGIELRSAEVVSARALAVARFELSQQMLTGKLSLDQRLDVEDGKGKLVHSLTFVEAFQAVLPLKHALIIQPDALVSLMIEDTLKDMGYTSFDYAATAKQAVAAAVRRCPNLIVADTALADGCGIETVRHICSAKDIPTVLVTEYSLEAAQRAPTTPVLQKPFRDADLSRGVLMALAA